MRVIYIILAIGLIFFLGAFSLNYWQQYYPLYLEVYDIGYHAAVPVGMDRAGGLTLISSWQQAGEPVPAYYPPLFHLCGLLLLRFGVGAGFLTKYFTYMLYPALLFSLWVFMQICFGSRTGFYSLALLSLPPLLMEKIWGHPTFGLFCVLMPLFLLSLLKRRYIIALVLTILSLAAHMSAGIIFLVLFIYALHSRRDRKTIFIFLSALMLLSIPLVWVAMKRVSQFGTFSFAGLPQRIFNAITGVEGIRGFFDYKREFYVYLGVLAALGAGVCYFRKGRYLLLPGLFIALVLAKNMTDSGADPGSFRYIQILTMVIFPMLGGVFLDWLHARLENAGFLKRAFGRFLMLKSFAILLALIVVLHGLFYSLSQQPRYNRTPTIVFLNWPDIWLPYKLLFTMEQRVRILELIKENVAEDEMIYSQAGINLGNFLSAFSRRSLAMDINTGPKLAILGEPLQGYRFSERMNPQFSVCILEDKNKSGKFTLPKPILSYALIKSSFILAGILILLDLLMALIALRKRAGP